MLNNLCFFETMSNKQEYIDATVGIPDDVVLSVRSVSKKFCRNLRHSMWYGIRDLAKNMIGIRKYSKAMGHNPHVFDSLPSTSLRSDLPDQFTTPKDHDTALYEGLRPSEFWALRDISFDLRRGECLGLIGRNGSGKTTLLRLVAGIFQPDDGEMVIRGRVGALIALGAGFHPHMTGRENVYLNGAILGLSKNEIDAQFDEIVDFSEIEEFIDAPVATYSSGMRVRLGFAIATAVKPDLLLVDEILAVGDSQFQAKCHKRIGEILANAAVVLVSHQMHHILKNCDHALLLENGNISALGVTETVLNTYSQTGSDIPVNQWGMADKAVLSSEIVVLTPVVESGGDLMFSLKCELNTIIDCDQCYVNIVTSNGVVHAQSYFNDFGLQFQVGMNILHGRIENLRLSRNVYFINLMLLSQGGKTTVLHLRYSSRFEMIGPINIGAQYYPRCNIRVDNPGAQ